MNPPCPLCGTGGSSPYLEEAGGRYWRCAGCGFVFLFPLPSPAALKRLYAEERGATFDRGAAIREAYEKRLEARLRLRVVWPALRAAPARSALEIGCGAGYLLEHLRRSGWEVAGTEIAGELVRFAREALGLEVGREPPPGRRFGAVLLFDVLSHLADAPAALEDLRDRLLPGGVLVLETGNAAELEPGRAGPLGVPEHVGHHSERSLRGLLERAGFRDVRVRRFNVEWQRWMLRKIGALRGQGPPGTGHSSPSPCYPMPGTGRSPIKILAGRILLGLRFGLGRLWADRRHACTLFAAARRRG